MRLLLAIPSLRCGGSERVMSLLAAHWAAEGHDVALATFEPPSTDFFPLDERVRRFVLGDSGPVGSGWILANRERLAGMREAVRATRPDAVVSFLYTVNLLAIAATRGLGTTVVVAERTDPREFRVERWQGALRRLLYPMADALVVQTQDVLQGWAARMTRRSRAFAIPNPVLPPELDPRTWTGPPLPKPFVASIGRLEFGKGFDVLIDAFGRVAPQHPEWSIVILGEGPEREPLRTQAERLGIGDRLVLPGIGDSAAVLAEAGVFATATRVEGFPNALLEAMANGLPVVATDCRSGPREIVRDGHDGYLVPVDDIAALAAALDRLLGDPQLRAVLGARARDVLDRFAVAHVAAQWEDVIERVSPRRP